MVTPRSSSIITSVAINACTLPFATMVPVTAPINAPNPSAAATASSAFTSRPTIEAATAPVSANSDPTDRSMPAVRITSVCAAPTMPTIATCCRISVMEKAEKKRPPMIAPKITSDATSTISGTAAGLEWRNCWAC